MSVEAGIRLSKGAYRHLEIADLVEKGLGGWVLTKAGQLRLFTAAFSAPSFD